MERRCCPSILMYIRLLLLLLSYVRISLLRQCDRPELLRGSSLIHAFFLMIIAHSTLYHDMYWHQCLCMFRLCSSHSECSLASSGEPSPLCAKVLFASCQEHRQRHADESAETSGALLLVSAVSHHMQQSISNLPGETCQADLLHTASTVAAAEAH